MSEHRIKLNWQRQTPDFVYDTYDRSYGVKFEGGQEVKGSAPTQFLGKAELTNPEELLAASLAACHMLTFLAVSCKGGYIIDTYKDHATATLEKNEAGKVAVTKILLKPLVSWSGTKIPDAATIKGLHDKAHANCMIANSIKSQVTIES
jgi:organic hydroperoxide reductase OsmC/OhrA